MHTGIILAVEAEDAEDALARAESFVESVHWSDWNEHNGRWSGTIPDGVLRYSDNPELFNETVDNFIESTDKEEIDLIKAVGHLSVEELITDPRYDYNFDEFRSEEEIAEERKRFEALSDEDKKVYSNEKSHRWRATKLLRMNSMEFLPETHFWDVEWHTRGRSRLDQRIKENPEKQFIVVWDFHF